MPTVFTIGETILDIIFENGQPVAAKAGGSMLNSAVSLGRCGLRVEMLTELGDDQVGELVMGFLKDNGVGTLFLKPTEDFKTPVSLAFLDEKGNAQYSFYKHYPNSRALLPLAVSRWPLAVEGDVVLFGSFYSLDAAIRGEIVTFVKESKRCGAIVLYDPNIRKNHLAEIRTLMPFVEENIALAGIVRGSDEDFENLFGLNDGEAVYEKMESLGCSHLIRTCGSKGAELFNDDLRLHIPAPEINVVSTIGAGDSFNAGMIYGMVKLAINSKTLQKITGAQWDDILQTGIDFASAVCASYDNYVPAGFMDK